MNSSDFVDKLNGAYMGNIDGKKMSPEELRESFEDGWREVRSNGGIMPEQLGVSEKEKDLCAVIAFLLDRLGGVAEISPYDLEHIYEHELRFEKDANGGVTCKLGNTEALENVSGIDL